MKKLFLVLSAFVLILFFSAPALAADQATFSASADKTTYTVGDTIDVSLNVDAGTYSSTLSTIDMTVNVSDPTVVEPVNATTPLTLGPIYTSQVTQSYDATSGDMNAAVFIDPNNKPANRSGLVGTFSLKADKAGTVTISYSKIQATQENDELNFITTSASSLTLNIVAGASAQTVSTATASTSQVKAATTVSTGPEDFLLIALLGGTVFFVAYKLYKHKSSEGRA